MRKPPARNPFRQAAGEVLPERTPRCLYYTIAEAARLLALHPGYLRKLAEKGEFGAEKWARDWLLRAALVDAEVERRKA